MDYFQWKNIMLKISKVIIIASRFISINIIIIMKAG